MINYESNFIQYTDKIFEKITVKINNTKSLHVIVIRYSTKVQNFLFYID